MNKTALNTAMSELNELFLQLRGQGGCPWDALQTDSTIKMYLLEESYEVLEAIEKGTPEDVCQELGDLLFQIIFLAGLAQERGEFDIVDVIQLIIKKMIRRHPHVFGNTNVNGPSEVSENWEKIKKAEKGRKQAHWSLLMEVPVNLPALLRAHRLSERASKVNFDWSGREGVRDKVKEEFLELEEALSGSDRGKVGEEIGDLLFSLVNLARHWGMNAENLLRRANGKFIERFRDMEENLALSGIDLQEATADQMDQAWEKIKDNK